MSDENKKAGVVAAMLEVTMHKCPNPPDVDVREKARDLYHELVALLVNNRPAIYSTAIDRIVALVTETVGAEREACAEIAEAWFQFGLGKTALEVHTARCIAHDIRARPKTAQAEGSAMASETEARRAKGEGVDDLA